MTISEILLLLCVSQIGVFAWCMGKDCGSCSFGNGKVRKMLKKYLGEPVNVKTDAGDVAGTLTKVDKEYIKVIKPSMDIVIIPLSSLNGIQKGV